MNLQYNRHRLFWLLQKWSSYSVWAHYARQFDVFVKAYEEALATWPEGERPPEYNVRFAYKAQDLYPKGLAVLAKGDRSVWREREDGYLGEAQGAAFRAMDGVTSAEINKYDGGERGVPLYTVWTPRLEKLRLLKEAATPEGAFLVYEQRPTYMDWHPVTMIGSEGLEEYLAHNGAELGPLPTVCPPTPEPTTVLTESGDTVSTDGIWELVLPHRAPGETDCLNYFVKGAVTPWIDDPNYGYEPGKQHVLPATWRLVWEDTRYRDGVIPDESAYLKPAVEPAPGPEQFVEAVSHGGRCEAGQPCPQDGTWWTPARPDARRAFAQGEMMPNFPDSNYGATIWYREAE
ncbi:Imm72 family immunity protein [Pseudogulbenkiania subflava]|uniref:Immunity protein 71 n=1 Tax=Pseudogulbenkiania subflava DSM 22618 TaxID=1123014 RepID=A0A1Y6CFM3_9NEIS|nr:Imm72 family immunity protein [Pseudogulbenkiania subflava]SMF53826.1 Immunity protein 71 [Pseudogulbenkiania subflava DSM 22618]